MKSEQNRRITTNQFGEINLADEELVCITNGVLGYEIFKNYVILEREEYRPFKWMIAVEDPTLMFVVIDPLLFFPDYAPNISKTDLKNLDISESKNSKIYSIVTLAEFPDEITVNLSGPICVNIQTLNAKQIALTGDTYSTKHNLFKNEMKLFKEDISC
jgi:flagellar assembly factor FliW